MAWSRSGGIGLEGRLEGGPPGLGLLARLATPIWLARPDGTVLWLNESAGRLLGVASGADPGDVRLIPDADTLAVLADAPADGRRAEAVVTFGRAPPLPPLELDARIARVPGGPADHDPPLLLIEGVADRVAHPLLLDAIDSVTEGFVLYDAQDRLVLCNQRYRDLFISDPYLAQPGTRFEAVLREGVRRGLYRVAPEAAEAWVEGRLALHRQGGPPTEVQLRDGRWLRIEERRTRDGGTVGVRTDITDLKLRELELAAARDQSDEANRRKSDYVHHLSHELRTPLTAVIGFAEIIRDALMGPLDNPRYREAAGQIVTAGDYMLELINNLLDLARIEAGRMELYEESCSLPLLVDATIAMMGERAARGGIALDWDLPPDLPGLFGDPSLIRQMLTNLIGNAVKFTPPGGRIAVGAALDADGSLGLWVADTGRGMAAEHIPLALSAFSQVHDRMTVPQHGSGLGLPLTRALMELHGGRLEIDSAPGRGTTVRLVFPAARVGVEEPA
ncbi:sensor histidine kinase [Azospirillum agricola]|uniref:sensor histidine kinase n=1 Tax=Azospirillum agricola TaxID=1720247 RepID=UPI000A0EEE29|nr:PAS domain-containing sensor histidine kinase [Azospirillum agricola]SMH56127.1 two-component system, cell cycle sensor histidine kinase PleC [Azospirillum lipoferum]